MDFNCFLRSDAQNPAKSVKIALLVFFKFLEVYYVYPSNRTNKFSFSYLLKDA